MVFCCSFPDQSARHTHHTPHTSHGIWCCCLPQRTIVSLMSSLPPVGFGFGPAHLRDQAGTGERVGKGPLPARPPLSAVCVSLCLAVCVVPSLLLLLLFGSLSSPFSLLTTGWPPPTLATTATLHTLSSPPLPCPPKHHTQTTQEEKRATGCGPPNPNHLPTSLPPSSPQPNQSQAQPGV
jgi:hypothetical protein